MYECELLNVIGNTMVDVFIVTVSELFVNARQVFFLSRLKTGCLFKPKFLYKIGILVRIQLHTRKYWIRSREKDSNYNTHSH